MNKRTEVARCALTIAACWVGVVVLTKLGGDRLAPPPLSLSGAQRWFDDRGLILAVFSLVRALGVIAGLWTIAMVVTRAVALVVPHPAVLARANRLTPRVVRAFLSGSLASASLLVAMPAAHASPPSLATMHLVTAPPVTTTTAPTVEVAPPPLTPASAPAPTPAPDPAPKETWTVEPGDSLWKIARSHLRQIRGHNVSEKEIAKYWRRIAARNKSTLVNDGDPDLLYPGQVLVLPPLG